MKLERTLNTKRNILVGEIDKFWGILLPFIVRTMMIHLMGAEYLGLTGLFYSIVQMLNLVEMGFGTAVIYSMYKPIADNDTRKVNALLRFYNKMYRLIGLGVAGIGLVVMLFLPSLITGTIPPDANIYILYLIFLGNTCLNYFLYPNKKALFTAFQRDDVAGRMHMIAQAIMYAAQMVSIYFARDFYLYTLTIPLFTVLYSLLCVWQARRYFPQYYEDGELAPEEYGNIKKQVIGLTVRKLATMSRNAFDSMFISAFLGLEMTAVYGNYYYVMDAVVMVLAVVKTSMAGGVGNSIAMESVQKNLHDMEIINFMFMCISGWCTVCLLCLYQAFMLLWAGADMTLPIAASVLFAVYFYVLKMGDIRTLYAESVGIWWQSRYLSVAEAAANLVMNYIFVRMLGLYGIILATLISYLLFNFLGGAYVLFRYYFTEGGFGRYLLSNIRYGLVTFGIAYLTYRITSRVSAAGWLALVEKAAVCMIFPGILYYVIYFKTREFQECRVLLGGMRRRKENG